MSLTGTDGPLRSPRGVPAVPGDADAAGVPVTSVAPGCCVTCIVGLAAADDIVEVGVSFFLFDVRQPAVTPAVSMSIATRNVRRFRHTINRSLFSSNQSAVVPGRRAVAAIIGPVECTSGVMPP
jgi:hypothetical protein